jgi:hypothetical protein
VHADWGKILRRDAQKGGAAEAAGKRGKRHPPRPGPSTNRIQPTTHPEPRTPSAPCRLAAAPVNPSSSSSFPLPPSSRERVFPFSPLPLACRPRPLTLPFPAPRRRLGTGSPIRNPPSPSSLPCLGGNAPRAL